MRSSGSAATGATSPISTWWTGSSDFGSRNLDEDHVRHAARSLRDPVATGRGRDGRGISGAGHAALARGGDQGVAGRDGLRRRAAKAIRKGGAGGFLFEPPVDRDDLRDRAGRLSSLHRYGAGGGEDPARSPRGRSA